MSISVWPAVPTSWWCTSTSMPAAIIASMILERRSWSRSVDVAGIARVGLTRDRIHDVARQGKRRHFQTGVNEGARRIRQQQHVALVDGLEAADRRAVESQTVRERVFLELLQRNREMLPGAGQIRETHVHDLHACFLRTANHIRRRRAGSLSTGRA